MDAKWRVLFFVSMLQFNRVIVIKSVHVFTVTWKVVSLSLVVHWSAKNHGIPLNSLKCSNSTRTELVIRTNAQSWCLDNSPGTETNGSFDHVSDMLQWWSWCPHHVLQFYISNQWRCPVTRSVIVLEHSVTIGVLEFISSCETSPSSWTWRRLGNDWFNLSSARKTLPRPSRNHHHLLPTRCVWSYPMSFATRVDYTRAIR